MKTPPDLHQPEQVLKDNPKHEIERQSRFPWLPKKIKDVLLRMYWPLKAYVEDWQDYSAELIGSVPNHAIRLWWYRHICRMMIGEHTSIHRRCRMYRPKNIVIGDHTVINYGVLLDGRSGLWIGNNVSISEGTVILTLGHDIDAADFSLKGARVRIEDYVFTGSFSRILPGVTLGKGSVVAVGAVVTKNIEPYSVVAGVPAKLLRWRNQDLQYDLDFRKRFG